MPATLGHKQTASLSQTQNHKAQLANAYNDLGKELSSSRLRVVGNYTLGRVIGEGAYGKVRIGTHRLTSTRVAIKQIPKAMSASLTREIHHHRQLHHPHITQMYEVIATESHIWIVTELCCGGELFDYLVEKGRLSEDETRVIFGQLCLAVAYLHDNNIVHRDLKLENVLLDERCRVKLGDFGFTREFERGTFMETFCGTTGYASPEMLQGQKYQGPEVDVWSLGIILYCLLTGTLPFDDDDEDNILVKDVMKRLTIPQILAHPWFTSGKLTYEPDSPVSAMPPFPSTRPATPEDESRRNSQGTAPGSSEASTQDSFSPLIKHPDLVSSTPTTPDEYSSDPFESSDNNISNTPSIPRLPSNLTIRKTPTSDLESLSSRLAKTGDRQPATVMEEGRDDQPRRHTPSPLIWSSIPNSKAPPSHPVRTPARTKRRSVSSILSDSASPTIEKTPTPLPIPSARDLDFMSLLTARTPVMFSTPPERHLLNTLALLGFDTAQIVHSVLSYACDASEGEKPVLEDGESTSAALVASPTDMEESSPERELKLDGGVPRQKSAKKKRNKVSMGVQTYGPAEAQTVDLPPGAPKFALVPPTPTFSRDPLHLRVPRSHPSTPSGSVKDSSSKGRKNRAGSVSIMQRATTALEAAGLVRKKSSEAVREEKERDRERSRDMDRDRRVASGDEPRSSHGSGGSSKITKSPPLKASKEYLEQMHGTAQMGSPWVLAEVKESLTQPGHIQADSAVSAESGELLTAFRLWFNEDRKGKRKDADSTAAGNVAGHPGVARPIPPGRRGSVSNGKFASRSAPRTHRPSISSRRSSSVNSRRSSGTSVQMIVLDSPQIPARRSFGSHTPNSERGEHSSRPSSIRSISMQPRHRKSPHRALREVPSPWGLGSSTRVVRQMTPVGRPPHVRSNSAASSIHSPPSSRPTSWYEPSESEGVPRTSSPFKTRSRRSTDDSSKRPSSSSGGSTTTFVAQKRQGPFQSPAFANGSVGRSSWKKSWGMEPPGWSSRTAHLPIEVLAILPSTEPTSIRDVFSDDDIPAFAGGLGQMGTSASASSAPGLAGPGHRGTSKRTTRSGSTSSTSSNGGGSRQKAGHSPAERLSPLPPLDTGYDSSESRVGRRQLPAARSGPAAIQEEDEGEEEE
ncbi:hypothetical protein BDZ97DRAFT_1894891 [Flammula alnicola]|nr:hypothetical protein BDZ97DRAFT_1894891 [Flammula alnicola]